jgi:urea transport system ATP-binding protein
MSPAEREQTARLLRDIAKTRAVLVIEHDMDFVARIAKKVTVLHLGKILASGTMEQIQQNEKVIEVYLGH